MKKRIIAFVLSITMVAMLSPSKTYAEELPAEESTGTAEVQELDECSEELTDDSLSNVEMQDAVNTETATPVNVLPEDESIPDSINQYLAYDGYTYSDGTLFYKGLALNSEGKYEVSDSDGQTWYYDPSDPEFDRYFVDSDTEEDTILRQNASGASYSTGLDGSTYTSPAYVDGKSVYHGVDVSYYQGSINWNALKSSGVTFAFIRVGYRSYTSGSLNPDSMYRANIEGAYAAGIRVGVYFFSQAVSEAEAVEEAQYAQQLLASYKGMLTMPVVMDYEYAGSSSRLYAQHVAEINAGLDYPSIHTGVVNSFCSSMTAAGYWAGVYANRNMLTTSMNVSGIGSSYYIWMANYTTATPYTGRINCWQYSSAYTGFAGYLSGNNSGGRIDTDFWYGSFPTTYSGTDSATATAFVTRLYQVVLQRQPDPSGLNHWVSLLTSGSNSAAETAVGFYLSKEMLSAGLSNSDYVERLYIGMMGRSSDEAGKAYWVDLLDSGLSYRYLVARFVASTEFNNLCRQYGISNGKVSLTEYRDQNVGVTKFVSRLYTKALGRTYDTSGLNHWCQRILSNTSRSNVLDVALTGFLHSAEFKNKNLDNGEYIKVLYRTFLGREYDQAGYDHWMSLLSSGTSRDEVARRFAYSTEFSNIMAAYGL